MSPQDQSTSGRRKLAAIFSADVAGYSRLMADDEPATVALLKEYRIRIGSVVARHGGRVVNAPGDNVLAQFPSAVEAVQAAAEIQHIIADRNAEVAPARQMHFRIGINLGDVIEEDDGSIYGDGVNIAARVEALADAGGICISSTVFDAVEGKLPFGFQFLGEQHVKNIARPISIYRVHTEPGAAPVRSAKARNRRLPLSSLLGATALLAVLAGATTWLAMRDSASKLHPVAEAPVAGNPVLGVAAGPAIAVLPFDNLSGDPQQDYFAEGITGDLITALSQFRELTVIARNSTFRYKASDKDIAQIARELGARYVLRGDMRRGGGQVRINAQLVNGQTGTNIWAETYDRKVSEVFAIQDGITQQVIGRVVSSLQHNLYDQAQRKSPGDITAYDLMLRASRIVETYATKDYPKAHELLEQAIAIDPGYSRAHATLAGLIFNELEVTPRDRDAALKLGEFHARRAVELDPTDSAAHVALANFYKLTSSTMLEAEAYKALELNPNNANAMAAFGVWFQNAFGLGRLKEGADMARRAMRLNPFHPGWYRWATMREAVFTRRYAQALTELNKMELDDGYLWKHVFMAMIHAGLGNRELASAAAARVLEINPAYSYRWHMDSINMHPSYWKEYRRLIESAGLPLGEAV